VRFTSAHLITKARASKLRWKRRAEAVTRRLRTAARRIERVSLVAKVLTKMSRETSDERLGFVAKELRKAIR
jgi:hypothetical protein